SIPEQTNVIIKLFDLLGKEVTTLVNEEKTAGIYKVEFNGSNLPTGVYFYRIEAGVFSETKKLILLK
ncbi:MAG TPA: T9SS type A sorting domain-containing protein, partial [Ignavibacteriaceae bacterium]|nr:T9SS type A sorting domain-containing protein [Ignavibacteriaceae bacterium]